MKKSLVLVLCGVLIGSSVTFAAGKIFPDVPADSFYADAVANLSEKGIINGYPDGTFGPGNSVNRAELAVILDRMLEYTETGKVTAAPTAVEPSVSASWYKPKPGISWQWQLAGTINTSYDVDLYDVDLVDTPQTKIDTIHNKGAKVICYFSAGTWEDYRDDADEFPEEIIGTTLEDWPDEKWLDVSNYDQFSDIMEARLDLAVEKGCDGVEPDNVDGYQNESGFDLTAADQLKYNKWLASEAHSRGLSIGLKNDLDQVSSLVSYFDFAVNEQCFEYEECDLLKPFTTANKAVLGVEYEMEKDEFCDEANDMNFSWLKMEYDLDGGRDSC